MRGARRNDRKHSAKDPQGPTADLPQPRLEPGARISQFRIEREIGRGGAGVVYLAHDTKLGRHVAVKTLPPELMRDAHMRSRLKREARLLASLDHPNIATIHDIVEQAGSGGYLILEYIEGKTLAERIAPGALDLREALPIARQIAEAVATAHDHGVTHRDLKPGNIKITPEGKVKVLDFGLAKALAGDATDQQSTITEPGRIMGTPAYMSPEQARGQATDKRSDIWSFGCILYEMLTGNLPFKGETISDTLANILQTEPDWHALPQTAPHNIQVLLRRCLEKDPHGRLRDIGDAGIEISETLMDSGSATRITAPVPGVSGTWGLRRLIPSIVGVVLVATASSMITWTAKRPVFTPAPVSSFPVSLPKNRMLAENNPAIAVSPDGKRLVYVGGLGAARRLLLREINQVKGKELPETKVASFPFFSPDGKSIGFGADGTLKILFLDGGKPRTLCDAPGFAGGTWCPDNTIFFTPSWSKGIWKISADGGVPEQVTTPQANEGQYGHWSPEALPSGEAVLFTAWKTTLNDAQVVVFSRETGESRILVTGASNARYAPTGHLLYAQSGTLVAAPFDVEKLRLGEPRPIIDGLQQHPETGVAPFSFSGDGLLYYVRGGQWLARRQLVWVSRRGEILESLPLPPQAYVDPSLSPEERRIAFSKFDKGAFNIWVYDLPNGPATQLTFENANFFPIWTPDGNRLTFASYRDGPFNLYWIPTDRSSPEEPLLLPGPDDQVGTSWSSDGRVLLFDQLNAKTGWDLCSFSVEDSNMPQSVICEAGRQQNAVFSPDGGWIAYKSDQEGQDEVYVSPYPKLAPKKISIGGGIHPIWSSDGKELFYRDEDRMIAVTIETEPELVATKFEVLFEEQFYTGMYRSYDVSRDGQRFLMVKETEEQSSANQLIVVHNWFEELKRLVPVRGAP